MSRLSVGQPRLLTWAAVTGLAILIFGTAMDGEPPAGPQGTTTASPSSGQVRLTGVIVPGTVRANGSSTSFILEARGTQITVISDRALPGAIEGGQRVVVEGQMRSDGVWAADQVIGQLGNAHRFPHG